MSVTFRCIKRLAVMGACVFATVAHATNTELTLVTGTGTLEFSSALSGLFDPLPGSNTTESMATGQPSFAQPITSMATNAANTDISGIDFSSSGIRILINPVVTISGLAIDTTTHVISGYLSSPAVAGGLPGLYPLFVTNTVDGDYGIPVLDPGQSFTTKVVYRNLTLTPTATALATMFGVGDFATFQSLATFTTSITVMAAPVPEPSTSALACAGIVVGLSKLILKRSNAKPRYRKRAKRMLVQAVSMS